MARKLKEIAALVAGELIGNGEVEITGIAAIDEAQEGDITFVANPRYSVFLDSTAASAVVVPRGLDWTKKPVLVSENPSLTFSRIIALLYEKRTKHPAGIHPSAVIAASARLAKGVTVGAHSFIDEDAVLGEGTIVYPNVFIGRGVAIGRDSLLYPNVTVMHECCLGERVIIHPGTVIGSDGFGYVETEKGHEKIPQIGIVIIEDDVEIGASVTIDRARFGKTVIGRGTKIDNLVQIAHNVTIGSDSIVVAQTGISGSSKLGKKVILAGQVGVVGHITIGDNVIVGAQSGVNKSLQEKGVYLGSPARPMSETKKIYVASARLPELLKDVTRIKKKLGL